MEGRRQVREQQQEGEGTEDRREGKRRGREREGEKRSRERRTRGERRSGPSFSSFLATRPPPPQSSRRRTHRQTRDGNVVTLVRTRARFVHKETPRLTLPAVLVSSNHAASHGVHGRTSRTRQSSSPKSEERSSARDSDPLTCSTRRGPRENREIHGRRIESSLNRRAIPRLDRPTSATERRGRVENAGRGWRSRVERKRSNNSIDRSMRTSR